ncbi:MAG: hypothetical protein ACAI38_26005 [Myxococcota bacterium]|nr:hypothetical protein [Myxococcota bacterium]
MSDSFPFNPAMVTMLIVAVVIGFIVLGHFLEKRRTEALRAFATSRRFEFAETDTGMLGGVPFKTLSRGRSQRIDNVIRGTLNGIELVLCDFRYVSGSGKNRRTNRRSLCLLRTPGHAAPPFFARRQIALFDGLGKLFGGQDINFPEDQAFSEAYVLQTSGDEGELRRFMNAKTRGAFIRLKDQRFTVENIGDQVLVENSRRLKVHQLDLFLTNAMTLRAAWS